MTDITYDLRHLDKKRSTLVVELHVTREYKIRMWLVKILLRLVAEILVTKIEFQGLDE